MKFISSLFSLVFLFALSIVGQNPVTTFQDQGYVVIAPKINSNGSQLVFMSNKSGSWELYLSKNIGTANKPGWTVPELIVFEEGIAAGSALSDPCLNATGDLLYFSAALPDTKGGKDLYFSEFINKKWQKPQNCSSVNTLSDETTPMITADNRYLFFSRKHTLSKEDEFFYKIYFAKRLENGKWSNAVMLPPGINAKDESYPFLTADNKMLFFASKQKNDLDGYNIYYAKRFADNIWSEAEPLTEINTDYDDISPSIAANNRVFIYNQMQHKRKETLGSAFTMELPVRLIFDPVFEFSGFVLDKNSQTPLDATLLLRYTDNMEQFMQYKTKMPDGNYQFFLPRGREFEFEVFCPNYSHEFLIVDAGYKTLVPKEPVNNNFLLFNDARLILNVFDIEIFEPLEGTIKFVNDNNSENITYLGNGRYEIDLTLGKKYNFEILVKNYESYLFSFDLTGSIQFNEFERDIELTPSKTPFEINIADIETDEAIDEVEIVITNLEKNETIVKKVRKDENGKYIVDLRDGDKYEINVNGPKGYAFYNTKVDMNETENKKLEVKLKPLKAKTKLVLNDITFETNSADLNTSSYEELDRVIKLLIDNPDIKIEISAHTDNVGSDGYNQKLSAKRAQSVVDYLINGSLPLERLIAKGYGESTPIAPNDTEENKAKNRRVELKIVDINENSQTNE